MNNTVMEQQQISQIDQLKQKFKNLINQSEATYIEIGMTLNELQNQMKEEGKLMEWLKTETRISYSTANRYMRVAHGYKDCEKWAVVLGVKKAYLLLKITDVNDRFEFIKKYNIKDKNYDEINELLLGYLNKDKSDTNKKPISSKSAIKKLKRTIDKEVDNCKLIIDSLGSDAPIGLYDIKSKLNELQMLLKEMETSTDSKSSKLDAAGT